MMLVDNGREDLLKVITSQIGVDTYVMGLYVNNHAIVEADTYASITECSVAGYAQQNMLTPSPPSGPVGGVWDSIYANVTFLNTSGSPVTIYGFFFLGASRSIFYGGALFGTPLTLPAGGSLIFSPSLNDTTN
jgi:hypothetical protein